MTVSGRISQVTNGMPSQMQVLYSNNMGVARYRLSYEYQPQPSPFFPSRITLYLQQRGQEIEYRQYDILSLKRGTSPLSLDIFSPAKLLEANRMALRFYTNDAIYAALPSGRLLQTPAAAPRLALGREDYYRNRYFYLALTVITLSFGGVVLRLGLVRTTKQVSNINNEHK
jgi:hypothetical protein